MSNFSEEILYIENELLRLKTASNYTSVKSASYGEQWQVSTGLYEITYENGGNEICANAYLGSTGDKWGRPHLRTPSDSKQIAEVITTDTSGVVNTVNMTIVSNCPIISVKKIT